MKYISTVILLLLFILQSLAQQIPNGNFENWTQGSGYADPTGWDTPNSASASIGVVTVMKESSIVQNGSFAVKLQTKSIFGTPIPGLITLGDFNINVLTFAVSITGGVPFTGKPLSLSGYFQYEPVFNDEAFIGAILLKQNGNNWDTIADGNFTTTSNIVSWTPFTATFNYRSNETPTHLNIIIMSSDRNAPQPNSTLYIDNLTLNFPANVHESDLGLVRIFQNSSSLSIYANENIENIKNVRLLSSDGKTIKSVTFSQPTATAELSTEHISNGIYILNIQLTNGLSFSKKVFVSNK